MKSKFCININVKFDFEIEIEFYINIFFVKLQIFADFIHFVFCFYLEMYRVTAGSTPTSLKFIRLSDVEVQAEETG